MKCQAGWITSWNQDCWEKYQQPQICRWYHSNGRKQTGTKEPLNESEKAGLKLTTQKTKIMASSPITSWQTEGEKVEAVTDFLFLGSKITANVDCSCEIRRCLLLGRKAMTNLVCGCLVAQSCQALCSSMNCSPLDSSVHGDALDNTGVGCHALLQGILPTRGSNPGLLSYRWILYSLSHRETQEYWSG